MDTGIGLEAFTPAEGLVHLPTSATRRGRGEKRKSIFEKAMAFKSLLLTLALAHVSAEIAMAFKSLPGPTRSTDAGAAPHGGVLSSRGPDFLNRFWPNGHRSPAVN